MESQAYNIIQITKQYRIFILPQMLLKWYTNEIISFETSSDQAFAQIFSPVIFVQVTTSLIWSSSLFNHEVYFAALEWNKRGPTPHLEDLHTCYGFCSCWAYLCAILNPFWVRDWPCLVLFCLHQKITPQQWTKEVQCTCFTAEDMRHSAFTEIHPNWAPFPMGMLLPPTKPSLQFWAPSTKIISRAANLPWKHPTAPMVGDYNHVRMFRTPLRCSQKQKTHGQIRGQAFIASKNFNCKKGEK